MRGHMSTGTQLASSVFLHWALIGIVTTTVCRFATGAVVTITTPVSIDMDSLQSLSSDGATLTMQQVKMAEQSEDKQIM